MIFNPKTEEELFELLKEGEYDFIVQEAEDAISKSGNNMIKLTLHIVGYEKNIIDYITTAMMFKLKHFCDSTGLTKQYEKGELCAADCRKERGRAKIVVEQDLSMQYPPNNKVKDYVVTCKMAFDPKNKKAKVKPEEDFQDDDIPF